MAEYRAYTVGSGRLRPKGAIGSQAASVARCILLPRRGRGSRLQCPRRVPYPMDGVFQPEASNLNSVPSP